MPPFHTLSLLAALTASSPGLGHDGAVHAPRGPLPNDGPTPLAYRLELTARPEDARFSGHVEITVRLPRATRRIFMHGHALHVTRAAVRVGARQVSAAWAEVDNSGVVSLELPQALPAGRAVLTFDYDAPFDTAPQGFYHAKVGDRWYAWTQFQSIYARQVFPSFDEPGFKTPFNISLTIPAGQVAISNAPETGVEPVAGGMERHVFAPTRPLPTYLVALDAGPFAVAAASAPADADRAYSLPIRAVGAQAQTGLGAYLNAQTPKILEVEESYFGGPIPVPKLDQVGSPLWSNAGMENSGAITYGDSVIFPPPPPSDRARALFGELVTHEIAHQWFGNLVTPAWWDDIWLNEAFANWFSYRVSALWAPDLSFGLQAREAAFKTMDLDALPSSHPVHQHIATGAEADSAFDAITYDKGAQVVAMFAAYLGDDTFRRSVRLYLARHRDGVATTAGFFQALSDTVGDPRIAPAMRGFVDQTGTPLITFIRESGHLIASQSAYALLGESSVARTWAVPLCLDDAGARRCTLLDKASTALNSPTSGVLVPNADGSGYYRFDMPKDEWVRLLEALPHLPAAEAFAVDDSLWASFAAGRSGADDLLREIRLLLAHPDPAVRLGGARRLSSYLARGLLPASAQRDYAAFIHQTYAAPLQELGFDPAAEPDPAEAAGRRSMREELVEFLAVDPPMQARLLRAAAAYLAGDDKALAPPFRDLALRIRVEVEGQGAAQDLLDRSARPGSALTRPHVLRILGAAGRADVASWALSSDRFEEKEKSTIASAAASRAETRELALDWLLAHPDALGLSVGMTSVTQLTRTFGNQCSVRDAERIKDLLGPRVRAAGVAPHDLEQVVEQVRACGRLKLARSAELAQAVHDAAVSRAAPPITAAR